MRIGLIRRAYNPYGGGEVFLERFIDELTRRGYSIDVFATRWKETPGVTVHRVGMWGPSFLKPLVFAINVRSAIQRIKPEVVISFERTLSQDIYRAGDGCHREWLMRRKKTVSPAKRILLSINPFHRVILFLERRLFRNTRYVVTNSVRGKEEIIRHYGLPAERIYVIYNGIDLNRFTPEYRCNHRQKIRKGLGIGDDTVVLLFVGSGFERKGLGYLIHTLPILLERKRDVRLIVIGKGRKGRYVREAERLGVGSRVTFLGPVEDVVRYYSAGDIFVLPSIYEPFSNACLEAMAMGLPVVTSKVNGASEIIIDGRTGGIVEDPTDPHEIGGKIIPFLEREAREMAGELARREALKYPIDRNVDEFMKLIRGVIDEKASDH